MRVLINGLCTAGPRTGIGHYTAQLVCELREQADPGDTVGCFPAPWVRGARAAWARARPLLETRRRGPSDSSIDPIPGKSWKARGLDVLRKTGQRMLARHFRAACQKGAFDLYHEPNFIPLESEIRTVTTLHDLSVLLHPEWHPADRVAHYEREFQRGLGRTQHFISVSDFGRREAIATLGLAPERITRIYQGIRPNLRPLPRDIVRQTLRLLGLPERYLLFLGTIEPRKNVLMLLRAYCSLPGDVRDRWPLLLVGGWGWQSADVATYLQSEARHKNVRQIGYIGENHICALYNGARALVFPSLYEGFGLPPLEMLACGGAVLASTADALAETLTGQAHLIHANDSDGWRSALHRIVRDDDWHAQLRHRAEARAKPYSWTNCARETSQLYRRLIQEAGSSAPLERRRAG